jgi:hypothetical protein
VEYDSGMETTGIELFVPVWYDVAGLLVAVLAVIAFVSFLLKARQLSALPAVLWFFAIVCVPVLGPLAWLIVGRRILPSKQGADSTPSAI